MRKPEEQGPVSPATMEEARPLPQQHPLALIRPRLSVSSIIQEAQGSRVKC